LEVIYQAVFAFGNQAEWKDDVTAVVVKKFEGRFLQMRPNPPILPNQACVAV
jgi:hypothetical protein